MKKNITYLTATLLVAYSSISQCFANERPNISENEIMVLVLEDFISYAIDPKTTMLGISLQKFGFSSYEEFALLENHSKPLLALVTSKLSYTDNGIRALTETRKPYTEATMKVEKKIEAMVNFCTSESTKNKDDKEYCEENKNKISMTFANCVGGRSEICDAAISEVHKKAIARSMANTANMLENLSNQISN
ncbi:hypothetical protein [Aestuariirhabdus sp. LZHN29]|uniref:hypothetical protein n=1 Tax=Aestuariirhabdus sp. LZHN29 TaxID=3417462 RepID=UPI003CE853B3